MSTFNVYTPDNKALEYMGRIDFDDPLRPMFIWAGSNIKTRFTGTRVSVVLKNIPFQPETHFGALVDGVFKKIFFKETDADEEYVLAEDLENGEHDLQIIKTMAGHEYFEFCSLKTDGELIPCKHDYAVNIEVYGDSVSAGEVTEALYYEGQTDPEGHANKFDNAYFAYPQILGRMLNARVHDIAQGGIALLDGTGWFCAENLTGMESVYDKLAYTPYYTRKTWDFSRFTPDFVIFAIGQNDNHPDPDCVKRPDYRRMWKDKYIEILRDLMGKYPDARFILTLTVLSHEAVWDEVLDEICTEINSERVMRFRFSRNAAATCGHPRATEQAEMAAELNQFIKGIDTGSVPL